MLIRTRFQNDHPLAEQFREMVKMPDFPCVGAKSAMARSRMDFLVARKLSSGWDDLVIHAHLVEVVRRYLDDRQVFRTLIVLFEEEDALTEADFERLLWERAQSLADKDEWLGFKTDPDVSDDPANPHFSLSFGGMAFFVVGLHPAASRPARRFGTPALVFNLHDQFEQLRESGRYEKLRQSIIERDIVLSGSPNPMLARHGESSEARQYSGRAVADGWECPFRRRSSAHE